MKFPSPEMTEPNDQASTIDRQPPPQNRNWANWRLWAVVLVLVSGGIGFTATSYLFKLPKAPNCPKIFWPIASASMRLYCAQLEANQGDVDSLLEAIALVEALPSNHPLRSEINRNVEEWAEEILNLAEKEFQRGKLDEAIMIARKIPEQVQAYNLVEEQIERWQSIWAEGEKIFTEVEQHLRDSNWNKAFRAAIQLLNLNNQYWATSKYEITVKQIQIAREESSRLDNAYAVLRRGGIDNLLQAIEQAEQIDAKSYAYQEAQSLISEAKDKLLDYIEELIDNRNWTALSDVADRIPEKLALKDQVIDWKSIASAGSDSDVGTVEGLKSAIVAAEQIADTSPLYEKSQELISRWKLEIEDVSNLAQARQLAQPGTVNDLNAAIAQAELVPQANPRYREARNEISSWNRKVQLIEDQPILDRARDLALSGDVASLQEAITQASLIGSNRALSGEAEQQIGKWRNSIERQEDQPFLDQAETLANARDYATAITAAQQIRRGRVLYREAQDKIRGWRQEVLANQSLQNAYNTAEGQTVEALGQAISILRKIPSSTEVASDSREAMNRWSYQLLELANDKANSALFQEAIALAKMIPSESDAYTSARSQIDVWQKLLQPPSPPSSPSSPSPSPSVSPL